ALASERKNWIPAFAGMTSGELPAGRRTVEALAFASERKNWIPACAGLRRQDAEANIRAANGPEGELRMQRVMTSGELPAGRRTVEALALTRKRKNWIPAYAGLRRQDAGANIRAANAQEG